MPDIDGGKFLDLREVTLVTIPVEVPENDFISCYRLWRFVFRLAVENVTFYQRFKAGGGNE